MTTNKIASALCAPSLEACCNEIMPPWCEGDAAPITKAYADVKTLLRQRDELITLLPAREAEMRRQCSETIMKVAADLRESLYELSA